MWTGTTFNLIRREISASRPFDEVIAAIEDRAPLVVPEFNGSLPGRDTGDPLTPREAERKGLVHETVSGKALDRAMEIARRLSSFPSESVAYIKRLVRNATETPLAQGLALERNLFLKLCITEPALARMQSYEEENITSPSRSIVVKARSMKHV